MNLLFGDFIRTKLAESGGLLARFGDFGSPDRFSRPLKLRGFGRAN
jgi:hypothetical protein